MFKRSQISTEVAKGPFYFTLTALVISIIVIIFLVNYSKNYLAIFAIIMMAVIAVASLIILFGMLSDYAYIKDDVLYMNYLFKNNKIEIKQIKNIKLIDDVYHVYNLKNDEVGTINGLSIGIDKIINKLDASGVEFL